MATAVRLLALAGLPLMASYLVAAFAALLALGPIVLVVLALAGLTVRYLDR